tara:strand:+ start:302 stop:406 length:105 start_codon:yes stop_codon:yes gene_type:complete
MGRELKLGAPEMTRTSDTGLEKKDNIQSIKLIFI